LEDLEALEVLVRGDPRLIRFLSSPQELDENKESIVRKLFENRAHGLLVRLFLLLLRKRRVLHLLDVIREYRALVEEEKGIAAAKVVTAVRLEEDLSARLTEELERITEKKVRMRPTVDPRIIGGLIILLEGKIYDRIVRNELDRLREDLLEVRVH